MLEIMSDKHPPFPFYVMFMNKNEHCMFKPNEKTNDTSESVLCGQLNGISQRVKQMFGALGVAESDSIKQCLNTLKLLKMISREERESVGGE